MDQDQVEIDEIVDEIVDDVDPVRIEREAERLGIAVEELVSRVVTELQHRLTR